MNLPGIFEPRKRLFAAHFWSQRSLGRNIRSCWVESEVNRILNEQYSGQLFDFLFDPNKYTSRMIISHTEIKKQRVYSWGYTCDALSPKNGYFSECVMLVVDRLMEKVYG
jgi:hypothetical protein